MDAETIGETVGDGCILACRDFIREELPDLASRNLARYLAVQVEDALTKSGSDPRGFRIREDVEVHQCVRVMVAGHERAMVVLGRNLPRMAVSEALSMLRSSPSRDRSLVYLYSFDGPSSEGDIAEAVMEAELLDMVRGTGIVIYFAMLDTRAGMGMMARIDGDMRSIEYLPH